VAYAAKKNHFYLGCAMTLKYYYCWLSLIWLVVSLITAAAGVSLSQLCYNEMLNVLFYTE